MPKKSAKAQTRLPMGENIIEPITATDTPKKKAYWEIRLPRFGFQKTSLNVYLVFTLIIFAFLLGMLVNKVLELQSQLKTATANTATNSNQQVNVQAQQPTPPPYEKISDGHLPAEGNNDAKVTLVEFGDFECPYCQQYFQQAESQVDSTYIKTGKVRFVWREFPLTSIHPNAFKAAEAAECANEQGQFWPYHDLLYQNQNAWANQAASDAENSFVSYAGQLNLNADQFRSCIDTDKYKSQINTDMADGNAAQVDGTPTFFINGFRVVGAVPFSDPSGSGQDLKTPIEKALAQAK